MVSRSAGLDSSSLQLRKQEPGLIRACKSAPYQRLNRSYYPRLTGAGFVKRFRLHLLTSCRQKRLRRFHEHGDDLLAPFLDLLKLRHIFQWRNNVSRNVAAEILRYSAAFAIIVYS